MRLRLIIGFPYVVVSSLREKLSTVTVGYLYMYRTQLFRAIPYVEMCFRDHVGRPTVRPRVMYYCP